MSTKKRRPVRSLVVLLVALGVAIGALVVGHRTDDASYTPLLALDLEGGTQLILTPVSAAEGDRAITENDITEAINVIRKRVDASGVAEAEISSLGADNISVALPGQPSQETLNLIRASSQMDFRPVLQVASALTQDVSATESQSGVAVEGQSASATQSASASQSAATPQSASAEQAESAASGATAVKPNVLTEEQAKELADVNHDGTLADMPQSTPSSHSDLAWITEQALFDLYTKDCSAKATFSQVPDPNKPLVACSEDGQIKYLLGPVDVTGANLESAVAGMGQNQQGQNTGEWVVNLQFDSTGTTAFAEASERLYGFKQDVEGPTFGTSPARNHFAVVLDGVVITAPRMNQPIPNGQAQISGTFTASSARALANQLNFGSLPLNFEVQSEEQISATLGSDHLQKGIWAGLIGLVLVVLYMVWQYRGLAILSAGSLLAAAGITYLVITLLSWLLGYRLSLSGVAGLIVSVGVTADSFIVYFERIRDEVRDGRPLVAAVEEGWDRARRTIIISDAVNLVAAVVLYVLAVGGVQGFAFTLGVTTVVDLVVIFLFTHPLMELFVRIPFFGNGHKLSGLDPEHLGARSGITYAGRGRVVVHKGEDSGEETPQRAVGSSLAERRRRERLAAQEQEAHSEESTAVDAVADETEEDEAR